MTLLLPLRTAALALCFVGIAASAHDYRAGDLKIAHPWARMTVPGQPSGGAYLKLQNTGSVPERLLGGSTVAAERLELHSMSMDGNVMKMREVQAIDVAPGQTVELSPGQLHIMLIGLKAPLKAGDKVPVTLKFEKAGDVKIELMVEAIAPGVAPSAAHTH
jgi:copper(I)-binding protein